MTLTLCRCLPIGRLRCYCSGMKKAVEEKRLPQVVEEQTCTFDIECTNCHVTKTAIDQWMIRAEKTYKEAGLGIPQFTTCCEGPYLIAPPATCTGDLLYRSLPGGEDR